MASEPVVVRVDVGAATKHVFMGIREQLIANELRIGGIPAHGGPSGITVSSGTLEVAEEDGLRVFTWTPPDQIITVPIPEGDNNPEVQALRASTAQQQADDEELGSRVGERHVAFLNSLGHKFKSIASAQKFVDNMKPKERERFFEDIAEWKADENNTADDQ